MKISHKKCRNRKRNILVSLRDREIRKRNGFYYRRELANFVDDCTAVSSFTNKPILTGEHLRSTFMIVFSHDGTLLASSHGNHKIKICRLPSMECIQTLRGHPRSVWCLNFHPSSNELLASGCLGGQVRVWDLQGRSEIWNSEKRTTITSLSFHPYERLLAIATGNEILLWDWSRKEPLASVATATSEEYIRLIRFDHHGHHLLTGITNPNRITQEGFVYGRQNFPNPPWNNVDEDVTREPDTIPEPSLADSPPDGSISTNEQGDNVEDSDSSSAAGDAADVGPRTASRLPRFIHAVNLSAAGNSTPTAVPGEQQNSASFETSARGDRGAVVSSGSNTENATSSPRIENAISRSLSSDAFGSQPSGMLSSTQSIRDDEIIGRVVSGGGDAAMETDRDLSLPPSSTSQGSSFSPSNCARLSSGNGFLTSSHQGVSSQRPPNRVVRVRRSYDGPELVQVRVISERFEGVGGDQPPRISAEDLSNAIIIRTEETFHVPDMPDSEGTSEPQAARALHFDSSSNDSSGPSVPSQEPPAGGPPRSDATMSPFTGLPLGSSLLDHVPNRNERVEHQVSYPVSASDGMVGHVTITRSSPADSVLLRALQLQRNSGPTGGNISRRTQGARRALPSQLHTAVGGRRGLRVTQGVRDEDGGTSEGGRRSRLSRSGFARTAIRRRSGHRRHPAPVEDDSPTFPQGEYRTLNQALADVFRGRWSNPAVASNINSVTHRLQWWKFEGNDLPDISNAQANILVPCCKLYSDASCDISPDEKFVVTFVPHTFSDQFMVSAYSLEECNFGKVLYSKKFGADAITLSISPSSDNLLVGVAAGQYRCPAMAAPMAMICSLVDLSCSRVDLPAQESAPVGIIKTLQMVNHPTEEQGRPATGLNIAKWVPNVGAGFVYGTDKGDLRLRTPRYDISRFKATKGITPSSRCLGRSGRERPSFRSGMHRQRGQSTQTRRRTHSAGTQTDLVSRFIRHRFNLLNPDSSVVGSRLAINMSDMFNSPNPHDQSTAATSSSDVQPNGNSVVSSDQPTSATNDVLNGDYTSTGSSLSAVAFPTHGEIANTSNSNPSEPVHPTSATSSIMESANTTTENSPFSTSHVPANTNSSVSSDSLFRPSSSEPSTQQTSSLSTNHHPFHVVTANPEVEHNSSDNQRILASSPLEPQIAHNISESMQGNSTENLASTSSTSAADVLNIPQVDGGISGASTQDQSVSRSSQVGLNGGMISLSGMSNDYICPTSATTVTSSDSSITVSHSSDMHSASESSYQTD